MEDGPASLIHAIIFPFQLGRDWSSNITCREGKEGRKLLSVEERREEADLFFHDPTVRIFCLEEVPKVARTVKHRLEVL